jgi:hypothetical protein
MFRSAAQRLLHSYNKHFEDPVKSVTFFSAVGTATGLYYSIEDCKDRTLDFENRVLIVTAYGFCGFTFGGIIGLFAPVIVPIAIPGVAIATYEKYTKKEN